MTGNETVLVNRFLQNIPKTERVGGAMNETLLNGFRFPAQPTDHRPWQKKTILMEPQLDR